MRFDKVFLLKSSALLATLAVGGWILLSDFGRAAAQYRSLSEAVDLRDSGGLLSATAGFRASGLVPGTKIDLSILENAKTLFEGGATITDKGTLVVGNIPLSVTGKSGLYINIDIPGAAIGDGTGKDSQIALTLNPASRQVFFSGAGIPPGTPLSVNIDGKPQDIHMATDWAGNFTTMPDANAQILAGKGSACLDIGKDGTEAGSAKNSFSLCFDLDADFGPVLTLAQTPGGPGGAGCPPSAPSESPFSTWVPPDDCAPGGTCLSVCNGAHMRNLFRLERELWVRNFMRMTEQFTVVMMQQAFIVGMFFDAKHQLELQRWFQHMHAEAHKDYQPSWQMCRFGTFSQGLLSAERKIDMNVRLMSKYIAERQLAPAPTTMTQGTGAPGGPAQDRLTRVDHFKANYCNPMSNNVNGLSEMCPDAGEPDRQNRDIDYSRGLETKLTLDLDFTDDNVTNDETDLIALSKNLFSHKVFRKGVEKHITNDDRRLASTQFIQDQRSVTAARGVAANSFAHIVGMRGQGTAMSATYFMPLMRQFGMSDRDITDLIGQNPSYFAQMEILTKKMFQHPNFYTELYDTPVNVERQGAALQAIKLMHDRDRFDASLRREMLVSLLVEMKIRRYQQGLERNLQTQSDMKK